MPLFGKKKELQPLRLRLNSVASNASTSSFKLLLRLSSSHNIAANAPNPASPLSPTIPTLPPGALASQLLSESRSESRSASLLPEPIHDLDKLAIRPALGKRVSTIVETNSDDNYDDEDYSEDESDSEYEHNSTKKHPESKNLPIDQSKDHLTDSHANVSSHKDHLYMKTHNHNNNHNHNHDYPHRNSSHKDDTSVRNGSVSSNRNGSVASKGSESAANQSVASSIASSVAPSVASSVASSGSDSDYEDHVHPIKPRGKVISGSFSSTIMEYCGLLQTGLSATVVDAAIAELKHTYSLLTTVKIHQLSCTVHREDRRLYQPLISDEQIELINDLKRKLQLMLNEKSEISAEKIALKGKSLFDRYGTVRDVIGRGLYGTIKIVVNKDSSASSNGNGKHDYTKNITSGVAFAVKELHRKRVPDSNKLVETMDKFIERVLSEFIISLTLNLKHIVKTVDLMLTIPDCTNKQGLLCLGDRSNLKLSQVMRCTSGGDLFTYITTNKDISGNTVDTLELDEIDCFVKQIARGLWYMHQHGVAHCDLKLENILILYEANGKMLLKISDFGKLTVFRTKWDSLSSEDKIPYLTGPIGSEPYIAPEEYTGEYLPTKKDFWAFGVIILLLFNIRRHYYTNDNDIDTPGGYLWHLTEPKKRSLNKDKKWKDRGFEEYMRDRMVCDYNRDTKEWLITKKSAYGPIDQLFENEDSMDEEDRDFCELRKLFIFKLLDPNPTTRMTIDDFVKGDWMRGVDSCF